LPIIKIYTDGAARGNPGPSASGYVIRDARGELMEASSIYNGIKTNNFAEYTALIIALEWCIKSLKEHKDYELHIFSDSELMIKQLTGEYRVKSKDLLYLNEKTRQLLAKFKGNTLNNLPRSNRGIKEVDKALNILLDTLDKNNNKQEMG
jgi:ribonuclease HI